MNFDFTPLSFDIGSYKVDLTRPVFLLLIIPALILAIVPFFKLRKDRRKTSKHLIPFVIHLLLIVLLSGLITEIKVTEMEKAPTNTNIIVLADMSESNDAMREEMNKYIVDLHKVIDENTQIGVVAFANNQIKTTDFGEEKQDYLSFDEEDLDKSATNIRSAIEYAKDMFSSKRQNKRIIILSDGRQTSGNAWSEANQLTKENIRLDAVIFDIISSQTPETQLFSLTTAEEIVKNGKEVTLNVVVKSTKETEGSIEVYEGENVVYENGVRIKSGNNLYSFSYIPEGEGIHQISAKLTATSDSIEQNNTLYSWFNVEGTYSILIVDGENGYQSSRVNGLITDCSQKTVFPKDFPTTMSDLLKYDQVVLMNVKLSELPTGSDELLYRYVEEIGRGLYVTCGSNSYNYKNEVTDDSPIAKLLPVKLAIDDTKERIAIMLVVDLSSSMKEKMGERMRYEVVLEGTKKCIDQLAGEQEDNYVGVILFDANAVVAVPLTSINEKEWIKSEIDRTFDMYFYVHDRNGNRVTKSEYENLGQDEKNAILSNDIQFNNNGEIITIKQRVDTGNVDKDGYLIRSYGTNYYNSISTANSSFSNFEADIKQMVFLSDGEPSDKGSGYASIVDRMASANVITSTIAMGSKGDKFIDELSRLATLGGGDITVIENDKSEKLQEALFTIASSIKGDYLNEREVVPRVLNNASVLSGVALSSTESQEQQDLKLGGYYGTTIKDKAKNVLVVDNLRPIYAEWEYGKGKVSIFLSDLSNEDWTDNLLSNVNGRKLVTNMLHSCLNKNVLSSGIDYSTDRTDKYLKITTELFKNVREGEALRAIITSPGGETEELLFTKAANKKYRTTMTEPEIFTPYLITVELYKEDTFEVMDSKTFASVGYYDDEYNIFNDEDNKGFLSGLANSGSGELMNSANDYETIIRKDMVEYTIDYQTPASIIALILFVIDIIFRNFTISLSKKKEQMTDEEQIESMRGR